METTENYGLSKPEEDDLYGEFIPAMFAENMDKIDAALYELSQRKVGGSTGIGEGIAVAGGLTTSVIGMGRDVPDGE